MSAGQITGIARRFEVGATYDITVGAIATRRISVVTDADRRDLATRLAVSFDDSLRRVVTRYRIVRVRG